MEENRVDVYEETIDTTPDSEEIEYLVPEESEIESSNGFGSSVIAGAIGGVLAIGGIKLVGKIKSKIAEKKALKEIQKTVAEAQENSES